MAIIDFSHPNLVGTEWKVRVIKETPQGKLLPQNVLLVAVANGANSEFSKTYEQYIQYFSVVIGYDKNNVLVDFGDVSKNTKTK